MRAAAIVVLAALALIACNRQGGEGGRSLVGEATNSAAAPVQSPEVTAFFADNARQPGVQSLPSGVQYKITRSGPTTGLHPQEADEIKINYEGRLVSGEVFDSSYAEGRPVAMPVRGLVAGFAQAVMRMRPGDEWTVWIPPHLGYAGREAGAIPPNSILIFRLELIDVLPAEERVGRG